MKKILVVDDDADIRESVADVLTDEGYMVISAVNGKDALAKLAGMAHEPCLVLLDMMMPEMTGEEFLKVLDDGHRLAAMPVVVVSATARDSQVPGGRRRVRKPVSVDALIAIVKDFCGLPLPT